MVYLVQYQEVTQIRHNIAEFRLVVRRRPNFIAGRMVGGVKIAMRRYKGNHLRRGSNRGQKARNEQ
jgi:hypothetical protein